MPQSFSRKTRNPQPTSGTNPTTPKRNRLTTTTDRTQLLAAFGRKLKKARQQKGLSPLQFYYKSGIDASNLAKYERGQREPGLVIIMIMAKTLEVHPHHLLDINFNFSETT